MTELRMTSVVIYIPQHRSETFHRLTEAEAKALIASAQAEGWVANIVTAPQQSRRSHR
jgi:hypothetical protein